MHEHSVFKSLDLGMLPPTRNTLTFEDEFLLLDNLDEQHEPNQPESSFYPFKLNFTILLFCVGGSMRFRMNLKEYELSENYLMILPQGSIGECVGYSDDLQLAMIAFTGANFSVDIHTTTSMEFRKFLLNDSLLRLSPDEMEESLTLYRLMRKKLANPNYAFVRDALKGYMQVLMANGCQWLSNHRKEHIPTVAVNRQQQLFDQFLALVQEHYLTGRSIQFYADKLCLTPKYRSQVIREISGRYAADWIKDYVILEAKALLKSKKYTVQQVSDRLHFSNASFFGKFFKAAVGCSPRRYSLE